MSQRIHRAALSAICTFCFTVLVMMTSGCGLGSTGSLTGDGSQSAVTTGLTGRVHGGQQGVAGAAIQLYEVGMTGYTAGHAKPILNTAVTTDTSGSFSITGDYTCDPGSYVYLTASGGNPGGGTNANLALMAALGPCSVLSANAASTYIFVSEETTIAAAYAMAQFAGGTKFGTALASAGGSATTAPADNFTTSSTNVQGIANAMAIAQVITNNTTGSSPGVNTNGTATPEWWQVHTLADMLAACINSQGTTSGPGDGTPCGTLFANVNKPTGTDPATGAAYAAPADTIQAALYMALNPTISSTQQTNLFGLIGSTSPYVPAVTSASKLYDLSLAISYNPVVPGTTTPLLSQPTKASIDQYGNVWLTNNPTLSGSAIGINADNGFLVEVDPTGNPIQAGTAAGTSASNYQITGYSVASSTTNTTLAGLNNGTAAPASFPFLDEAIDTSGNVWMPDYMKSYVVKVTGSGAAYTSSGYATGLHNGGNGNDPGGSGAAGYILPAGSGTGNGTTTSIYPTAVAVDGNNDVFIATNAGTAATTEALSCATYTSSGGVSTSGDKGLLTFVGGSATNVQSGRFIGEPYGGLWIDGGSADMANGGTIPGSPFVWAVGYQQGGENVSIDDQYAGTIAQNYTTSSGANSQFTNASQLGCPTSLSYQYVSSSSTDIGISSTLDTSAVTALPGTLGTNGANSSQVTVVPSDVGNGDAAAYLMGSPYGMNIDGSGNLWISNTGYEDSTNATPGSGSNGTIHYSLTRVTPNYGASFTAANAAANFSYTIYHDMAGLSSANSSQARLVAADGGGNIWFTLSPSGATVGSITANGSAFSPAYASTNIGFQGSACPSTCTFTGTATAYTRSNGPKQIAIDGSGNVWMPQQGSASTEVTSIIGIAVPVATPLSLSIKNGTFGKEP